MELYLSRLVLNLGSCKIADDKLVVVTSKEWPKLKILWLCNFPFIQMITRLHGWA